MRRALASALTCAVCCLTLAACSSDEVNVPFGDSSNPSGATTSAPATSTSPATPSTTTATTSSDSGHPTAPVMPALARQQSTAGAKAFIRYFVAVFNYAFHTGRSTPLTSISSADCRVCQRLVEVVDKNQRLGGYQVGGDWFPGKLSRVPTEPLTAPVILAEIHIRRGYFKTSAAGSRHAILPADLNHEFRLRWQSSRWVLTDLSDV